MKAAQPFQNAHLRVRYERAGFTLVELLVVMVVLAFGLITLLMMLKSASANNADAHFLTVAQKLAEGRLEQVISDRRTQSFAYITNANYAAEDPVSGFAGYRRTVNIYYVNLGNLDAVSGSSTNYKRVDVAVEHTATVSDFPPVEVSTVVTSH